MHQFRLTSLRCRTMEDWTGPDEAYLLVKGRRHWGDPKQECWMGRWQTEELRDV